MYTKVIYMLYYTCGSYSWVLVLFIPEMSNNLHLNDFRVQSLKLSV